MTVVDVAPRVWQRNEGDFVTEVLRAGKSPFFLLPFVVTAEATEDIIGDAIHNFVSQGVSERAPSEHAKRRNRSPSRFVLTRLRLVRAAAADGPDCWWIVGGGDDDDDMTDPNGPYFRSQANMTDPRVHVVLARYDLPHVPIEGGSSSIAAALWRAKSVQPAGCINPGAECDDRKGQPARCGRCCVSGAPVPHSSGPGGQTYGFCPGS